MAITYPLDLLADFQGGTTDFELLWRQEQSRQASGRTIVKDMGSPLWRASFQSRPFLRDELDEWRARLDSLENGLQTFKAWSMSRPYPIAYPGGVGMGSVSGVQVASINANRKSITLKGLPPGFKFKIGDMLQIGSADLHRVQEGATASGVGATGEFEVRPHLWPATAVNDRVIVVRPACNMAIVPGSLTSTADMASGIGAISFQAIEAR